MRPDQVIVHVVDPTRIRDAHLYLTEEEKARTAAFRSGADSDHWAACRAGLRLVLAKSAGLAPKEVPITLGPNGKPLLDHPFAGLHFNLSHCRDLALVAVAATPVGIDLERSDRASDLLGCEDTFCHPRELAGLPLGGGPRAAALLEIWAAKESVLKALGTGFFLPPEEVFIARDTAPLKATSRHESAQLADLSIHRLHHPFLRDHTAFVAVPSAVAEIEFNVDFI